MQTDRLMGHHYQGLKRSPLQNQPLLKTIYETSDDMIQRGKLIG